MTKPQSIIVFLTIVGLGIGLLAYLHQRNKDKPIFEYFFYPDTKKSVRVEIRIKNKSKEKLTVIKVTANSFSEKLFIANSVVIEKNGIKLHLSIHKDFCQTPSIYVPPEDESSFEFFVISNESLLDKTISIKLQTDASLFSMAPKYKIIKKKYAV